MSKIFLISLIAVLGVSLVAVASSPFDIEFPIPELGNCIDKASCKIYCDDSANKNACLVFGQKHGFVDKSRTEALKQLPTTGPGPGNCKSQEECRVYCSEIKHAAECFDFAEKHNLLNKNDIKSGRDFLTKTGPGGCKGAVECRTYCDDISHREECLEFAHRKGLISKPSLDAARNIVRKIEKGGPGGCKSEDECRVYCDNVGHVNECVAFAEENGFVSKQDAMLMRKAGLLKGPGGCSGKNECEAYCKTSEHQKECVDFAEKHGLMSKKEAEMARKFAGKPGPGGCVGEECRRFCTDPKNAETCFKFAEDNQLIAPQDLERARKFMKISQDGGPGGCKGMECAKYCRQESNREACIDFAKKNELMSKDDIKDLDAGQKISKKMKESGGPGGCKTDNECRIYCTKAEHVEECVAFGAVHGGMPKEQVRQMLKRFAEEEVEDMDVPLGDDFEDREEDVFEEYEEYKRLEEGFRNIPSSNGLPSSGPTTNMMDKKKFDFVGPGGCKSGEECMKYCTEHKDECLKFKSDMMPRSRLPYDRSEYQPKPDQKMKPMPVPGFERQVEERRAIREPSDMDDHYEQDDQFDLGGEDGDDFNDESRIIEDGNREHIISPQPFPGTSNMPGGYNMPPYPIQGTSTMPAR